MNLSFIKLDINIMDDTKIKAIRKMPEGSKIFELWIGILCLAMKSGHTGCVEIGDGIPFNADTLSNHFGIDNMTVTLALQTFERFKMIELFENGTIFIKNFEKHQQLDKINNNLEKTRKRVEKYRKKQKLLVKNVTSTEPLRNAIDIDKDVHKDIEKKKTVTSIIQASPDTSLFNQSRNYFITYTKDNINPDYLFDNKEGKHLKLLLSKIRQTAKNPAITETELYNGFMFFVNNANDQWLREHWELSILNSQFNKIILYLRKQQKGANSYDRIINAIS